MCPESVLLESTISTCFMTGPLVENSENGRSTMSGIKLLSHTFSSSRRRYPRCSRDWSSDVCSSDLSHVYHDDRKRSLIGRLRLRGIRPEAAQECGERARQKCVAPANEYRVDLGIDGGQGMDRHPAFAYGCGNDTLGKQCHT